jgi:hypothetical protein
MNLYEVQTTNNYVTHVKANKLYFNYEQNIIYNLYLIILSVKLNYVRNRFQILLVKADWRQDVGYVRVSFIIIKIQI